MRNWYYILQGQQFGPFSEGDIQYWLQSGQLPSDIMVWTEGMTDWMPAKDIENMIPLKQAYSDAVPKEKQAVSGKAQSEPRAKKDRKSAGSSTSRRVIMKRFALGVLGFVVVLMIVLAVIPTTREEIHWIWTSQKNSKQAYESFIKTWPSGRHTQEANRLLDGKGWSEAVSADSIRGFEAYLQTFPSGRHTEAARAGIETIRWREATEANTVLSLQGYMDTYPSGRFTDEATVKLEAVRGDDTLFLTAQREGTKEAINEFLVNYPGHKKEASARSALRDVEGKDIVDLLNEKRIEVKTKGSGIRSVDVSVRRLVPHPVTVRIPVGTFFVARNKSSQNMVTTAETIKTLRTENWTDLSTSAACANRPRDIPGSEDSFTVRRSPFQAELNKLVVELDRESAPYDVKQAAVWIVTDNADYDDLGLLVSKSQFQIFGGTRVINEYEAAKAMKICHETGINITKKAIWGDRDKIIKGLKDKGLKEWLQKKAKK